MGDGEHEGFIELGPEERPWGSECRGGHKSNMLLLDTPDVLDGMP